MCGLLKTKSAFGCARKKFHEERIKWEERRRNSAAIRKIIF